MKLLTFTKVFPIFIRKNGVILNRQKYTVAKSDGEYITGTNRDQLVICAKTGETIVIAIIDSKKNNIG